MTTPLRCNRKARLATTLLLLALPLAGCVAPSHEEAGSEPGPDWPDAVLAANTAHGLASGPGGMSGEGAAGVGDAGEAALLEAEATRDCTEGRERTQEFHPSVVVVRVLDCIVATAYVAGSPLGVANKVNETFDIAPGADRLRALFHLHGPEAVRAWLHVPGGPVIELEGRGDSVAHSTVTYEIEDPSIGTWRLVAVVEDIVAARPWSFVTATTYEEGA